MTRFEKHQETAATLNTEYLRATLKMYEARLELAGMKRDEYIEKNRTVGDDWLYDLEIMDLGGDCAKYAEIIRAISEELALREAA